MMFILFDGKSCCGAVCEAISYKVNTGQPECTARKRQSTGWIIAKATWRLTDFPVAEKMQLSELIPDPEWEV